MFRSFGIAVVALGLAAGSLQAQDEAADGQWDAETHQQPPVVLEIPSPLPVTVVEGEESSKARQSREQQAAEREKDDLIAQQRMAEATEAMNEATQSMKWAAWFSFGAVSLGTILLIWTLVLTRSANQAARDSVSVTSLIGFAQQRPYVRFEMGVGKSHWGLHDPEYIYWEIPLQMRNTGNTPTRQLKIRSCWRLLPRTHRLKAMPRDVEWLQSNLLALEQKAILTIQISTEDFALVQQKKKNLFVFAEAEYQSDLDHGETKMVSRTAFSIVRISGGADKYWDPENPVSITWKFVPTFNCFDSECDKFQAQR